MSKIVATHPLTYPVTHPPIKLPTHLLSQPPIYPLTHLSTYPPTTYLLTYPSPNCPSTHLPTPKLLIYSSSLKLLDVMLHSEISDKRHSTANRARSPYEDDSGRKASSTPMNCINWHSCYSTDGKRTRH